MIGELVMRCFHARTAAHVLHLKTRSYAEHKALNEFYDEIVDLIDSVAETYQGAHGLISDYPTEYRQHDSAVEMISDLKQWIDENRYDAVPVDDTYIHNLVDEIVALCSSTLYKLKFLK